MKDNAFIYQKYYIYDCFNGQLSSEKVDKTSIVQTEGDSTTAVMSQKAVTDAIANLKQQTTEFADSVEWLNENGDTSKMYVLPDGMIYAYMLTEKEVESAPSYTNALDGTTKHINQRWSRSSKAYTAADGYMATDMIPVKADQKVYVNLGRRAFLGNYPRVHYLDASGNYVSTKDTQIASCVNIQTDENDVTSWVAGYMATTNDDFTTEARIANADNITQMMLVFNMSYWVHNNTTLSAVTEEDCENIIVSIDNPIVEGGGTTIVTEYAWASTGHSFVPSDNEDRIIALENTTSQHTTRIVALEKAVKTGGADESEASAYTRIKNWKYPIHEDAPVFLLEENKPAIASNEQTTDAIYAKYDALMAANSHYITKQNCGMASDGTTPIYVYHFKEPEPHYNSTNWSETKPVILVVSGVHPTEQSGVHSMYYAMEEITTNTELLDLRRNLHFIVMPMINPTAFSDSTYGVRNPDGIQVHYNFEVDFKYPTDSGYVAHGQRNHGGETPLSLPETQYFDALMNEYKDTLACVLSCHNNDVDTQYGTGFVWSSCATHFMCNLGFRLADKLSAAWREKHGTAFDEGVRWANEYALAQAAAGSSIFNATYIRTQEAWDYRVGRASISGSGGTEYKQALKYGVHGINVEVCDRCMVLDKDFNKKRTSNVTTMGAETYINFFRTFMAAYDPKNKKDYAPNLPWGE